MLRRIQELLISMGHEREGDAFEVGWLPFYSVLQQTLLLSQFYGQPGFLIRNKMPQNGVSSYLST